MLLPKVVAYDAGKEVVDTFYGLNRDEKIREGEWSDELNLTSDRYPMLSVRKKRSTVRTINGFVCSMIAHGEDFYFLVLPNSYITDATAAGNTAKQVTLYKGSTSVATFSFDTADGRYPGKMILFGAYIIVPGIRAWYNTADGTSGAIDASFSVRPVGQAPWTFNVYPVDEDGEKLTINARMTAEDGATQESADPQTYADGQCYAIPETKVIRQYKDGFWRTVNASMRIEGDGINAGFEAGDVVEMKEWEVVPLYQDSAREIKALGLNGYQTIADAGTDYIVLKNKFYGYTSGQYSFTAEKLGSFVPTVERVMPDMDYVIECNNRLWGCKYGKIGGKMINEIYGSELGNFKNWRVYDGTSMASWAASVGTDGPWTGAIAYQGKPHFFKEKHLHKVYISATGAHQIVDTHIKGVRRSWSLGDCSDSLCEFDRHLYWLSNEGVCRYDGSSPVIISEALGEISKVYSACAGGTEGKLYMLITLFDELNEKQFDLYTYDVKRGIWHVENSPLQSIDFYVEFAKAKEAFYVCQAGHGNLPGYRPAGVTTNVFDFTPTGTSNLESGVSYSCTSGLIGWQNTEQKYVSRFDMRLTLPKDATMKIEIEYDSDGTWIEQGTVTGSGNGGGTGSIMIPVRPRRCDHFRIRLSGTGEMRMYSWAKRLLKGSDVV